jgi:branched-chain amino acid transport system permease protein
MKNKQFLIIAIALLLFYLAPLIITNQYYIRILANLAIWTILGTSLEIISGACGQLSLGHAAFFGLGGYFSAIISLKLGLPYWIVLPSSGIFAALFGILVGIPSLRFRGPYLVLVTIAFNYIAHTVFLNWKAMTGGYEGMTQIPSPSFIGVTFAKPNEFIYIAVTVTFFLLLIYYRIYSSPTGRAWLSIRESESASEACGISVAKYKLLAFGISTFYAGIAGSLFVHLNKHVSPEPFNFDASIKILALLIIGGMNNLFGGFAGAVIFTAAHEALAVFPQFENLLFGILLIIMLKFFPEGIVGLFQKLKLKSQNKYR